MTSDKNNSTAEVKKKRYARKSSGIASVSFLISLLDKLGDAVYDALINGFFGNIFTAYNKLQNKFSSSLFGRALFGRHRIRRGIRAIRRFLADTIDSSFFVNSLKKLIDYFCCAPLHFYGNFTLFFGIYTVVVYLVNIFLPDIAKTDAGYLIVGIAMIIISVPALFSKVSLITAVKKSAITKMIFAGGLGFSEESFDAKKVVVKGKGNFMLFLGLIAGFMTFLVHPAIILLLISLVIALCLVVVSPEIGVLLAIIILPFLTLFENPTVVLCGVILITAASYLLKLIRGKRVFKLELIDAFVLLFSVLVFLSSLFSAGGEVSLNEALVTICLILGYFLMANLMRTEKWVKRCVVGLIGSSAIVAFAGVAQYFLGEGNGNWLDLSLFSDIKMRVTAFFDNPNVLATYLVIVFPFVLATFCLSRYTNEKILSAITVIAFVACTVFTWSRGAWLAMMVSALVFFIIYKRKTFRIFGTLLILIPMLPIVLPSNVLQRLLSITNLSDSSIAYRIYTWKGSLEIIKDYWLGGIGFGNEAFRNVYPKYAYAGIEAAEHSHNLALQIILGTGVIGLVLIAAILFLASQKFFEYIRSPESNTSKIYVISAMASIVAAMVMGVFDYIWYNYRVFYIFWVVIAIGCAFVRVGNYENRRKQDAMDSDS